MTNVPICPHIALSRTWSAFALACVTALTGSLSSAAPPAVAAIANDHAFIEATTAPASGTPGASKYRYLFSPSARWAGTLHWKYNHTNAPSALAGDKSAVVAQLKSSFDKWTAQCGITYAYDGETETGPFTVVADSSSSGTRADGVNVIGWGSLDPMLSAFTYDWWIQSGDQHVIFDADTSLNRTTIGSLSDLDRAMTHEWGHSLGLDHSNVEAAIMAGPPMTSYNGLATPQPDDIRGCRCQYGLPFGVRAPYACSLPALIDFGTVAIGASSPVQSVAFKNSGNAVLSIQASIVDNAQFTHVAGCQAGTSLLPGASCTLQVQATPATTGAIAGHLTLATNDGDYPFSLQASGVQGSSQPAASVPTVDVVEYYNASLDHFFITWKAAEIMNLDMGITPTRWTRTGKTFKAYATAAPGTSQVCRLYIPPADGDSHFFGRGAAECAASKAAHPDFVVEDSSYMEVYMPQSGTCPGGSLPVYRLFNGRADANHRYVTDRATRTQMIAAGWIAEGDGPDLVAMCIPAA